MMKLFLVCNAHIDPVWQWNRDEGISAAISTFRSAAKLLEEYDFVFCHNEAMLYECVERYDPDLFETIRKLVAEGRWRIMGGWYLQPDCNLPSAESLVRQILVGQRYFEKKFDWTGNRTAASLDAFGHGGGLPQILKKTGYDSYLVCRPMAEFTDFGNDFVWQGCDGSEVTAARVGSYNNDLGMAARKIRGELARLPDAERLLVLWGVGNHGGGPSRLDLGEIAELQAERKDVEFLHVLPEDFFDGAAKPDERVRGSLYPCFPGCYLAQTAIKKGHRALENLYFDVEKTASAAALAGLAEYPEAELGEALRALMLTEFHDILPGTSIREAMEESLRRIGGGMEILSELRMRLQFAFADGDAPAGEGCYPIFVFNPEARTRVETVEAPIMMSTRYYEGFADAEVWNGEDKVPSQVVKEDSNIPIEWSKKVAFRAELPPLSAARFDVKFFWTPARPVIDPTRPLIFEGADWRTEIGADGLLSMDRNGVRLVDRGFLPVLFTANEDPWAMQKFQNDRLGERIEDFRLATHAEAARILCSEHAEPLRLTEDGPVFAEAEALFVCGGSSVLLIYRIDKSEGSVDLRTEVTFAHRGRMLKLLLDCPESPDFICRIAGGSERYPSDGRERVMHRWTMRKGPEYSVLVSNDGSYAASALADTLELALVRTSAYSAHYIQGRQILRGDRHIPRMDLGENRFRFRVDAGRTEALTERSDRLAALVNEPAYVLGAFPKGGSGLPGTTVRLDGSEAISLIAFKESEDGGFILRLENGTDQRRRCAVEVLDKSCETEFLPFELKTLVWDGHKLFESAGLKI